MYMYHHIIHKCTQCCYATYIFKKLEKIKIKPTLDCLKLILISSAI